jgi:uncharacterized protein
VVGASRDEKKFGNIVYRDLKAKGYRVFAVNPNAEKVDGDPAYPNLGALPEPVGGVVLVIPPKQSEQVVQEADRAGIHRVWMQQGAESSQAVAYCKSHNMQVVYGECLLMFGGPVKFPHNFHRWINKVSGRLPK